MERGWAREREMLSVSPSHTLFLGRACSSPPTRNTHTPHTHSTSMASLLAPAQRPVLGASAAARRPAAPAPRVLAPPPAAKGKKGNMMHLEVRF